MIENHAQVNQPNWRLLVEVAIVELSVLISLSLFDTDSQLFLFLFIVGPAIFLASIALIVLLIRAAIRCRHQFLPLLATLALLWVLPVCLTLYERSRPYEIRDTARWVMLSRVTKQTVLGQPNSPSGDFKHIEWDATGFAGIANNTRYVVFDPADTLSTAAKGHRQGKFTGIPCELLYLRRLESHWYAVSFYTDETWDHCSSDDN
jgi:hypothetical protein